MGMHSEKMTRTRFTLLVLLAAATDAGMYLNMSGDITLGALFPVHRKGSNGTDCGGIQPEDGIQPLEAMLYTLEQINQDPNILPGIKLGALVFDSCNNPNYALEQALYFVKGFIAHVNTYHNEPEFHCSDGSLPKFLGGGFEKVVAVLASQSSSVTIQVASMLRLFTVPQISYMATSPSLSSKEKFPHFFRTVPSDVNQARVMLEILSQFKWTYVSIVYSDTEYGNHGYEMMELLAKNYSVCFSAPQRIDNEKFITEDYDNVIKMISNKTDVQVVIIFAEKSTTLRVLDAARRLGVGERFVWIGSDAWSTASQRELMTLDYVMNMHSKEHSTQDMTVLEGALAVQPLSRTLSGFDEYFTNLTIEHQTVNPWFREFWHTYHGCNKDHTTKNDNVTTQSSFWTSKEYVDAASCANSKKRVSDTSGYKQQRFLHFVRDAVYAVAYALHDLHQVKCGKNFTGICPEMDHLDGDTVASYLSNVTFHDEGGKKFRFTNNVDGPPRYSILNFQKSLDGTYRWHVIGNYTLNDSGDPILHIDESRMKFRGQLTGGREYFPNSTCGQPCKTDQVQVRERIDMCCYRCRDCGRYQQKVDEHRCEDCPNGTRPTKDRKFCAPIPEEFIDYSSPWAVAAMAVASCGIIVTVFVLSVFWIYSETPVIKASGRELSSLSLLGTLLSFLMTFAVVAKPNTGTCTITRFGIGICYTLCYAASVTKTNRIHRIFNNMSHSPHKPKYTSPKSQLIITGILVFVEVLINAAWLLKIPPTVTHVYPGRDGNKVRICHGLDDRSYMVGLIYPFILIVICTIYAIKTRKCPEGFNETRYIAFTNYTTIILWLAFVPLYLASTNNVVVRVITLALSLSLSGLVQLACLFFPKVYIVLMKPEKNTKEVVMAQHRSSSYLNGPATPVVVQNENGVRSYVHGSESSIKSTGKDTSTFNLWKFKPILRGQSVTKDQSKNFQIRTM